MKSLKTYLQTQGLSKTTVDCYTRHSLEFLSFLDKENIEAEYSTTKEITAFIQQLTKREISTQTKAIYLHALKSFFNWQIDRNLREDNPAKHIKLRGSKRQKLHLILSKEELEKLYLDYHLAGADDPRQNRNWWQMYVLSRQRNKVILSLMIHQGLTTAEVIKMGEKDLKLQAGKIYIQGGRKSAERELELKSHQMMGVMEYYFSIRKEIIKERAEESEQLFPSLKGSSHGIDLFKPMAKELKEGHTKFQNFKQVRASVITHWLSQYNLREVQYMAGHKHISSTEKYKVNQLEDLQTDIDQFHPSI